jgi:hypothetical protein
MLEPYKGQKEAEERKSSDMCVPTSVIGMTPKESVSSAVNALLMAAQSSFRSTNELQCTSSQNDTLLSEASS